MVISTWPGRQRAHKILFLIFYFSLFLYVIVWCFCSPPPRIEKGEERETYYYSADRSIGFIFICAQYNQTAPSPFSSMVLLLDVVDDYTRTQGWLSKKAWYFPLRQRLGNDVHLYRDSSCLPAAAFFFFLFFFASRFQTISDLFDECEAIFKKAETDRSFSIYSLHPHSSPLVYRGRDESGKPSVTPLRLISSLRSKTNTSW